MRQPDHRLLEKEAGLSMSTGEPWPDDGQERNWVRRVFVGVQIGMSPIGSYI